MRNGNAISTPQARTNPLLRNVYLWMTAGLALTTVVAYFIGTNQNLLEKMYSSGIIFFLIFAQLAIVMVLSFRIQKMNTRSAIIWFAAYSICTGAMLSSVLAVYAKAVVARAFLTTALMFGGMSIFAMTTRRDLSKMGNILVMALIGMLAASVVNLFLHSEGLYYLMSFIGVALFCGLTAWDTQKIMKLNYDYGYDIDEDTFVKLSIICALELYLDFINIFLYLLRIFGRGNRN
ncbi:MAG: Bax inhibitor-1/YccA family protein [Spirochaetales bacterium]|jgi:FtsH-binding integral membrane protein|nr:Bax inhibitor-1/YccA family protein [Spirochaetales bacterium]